MGAVFSEPKRAETREQKISRLERLLAARTKPDGNALKGYTRNVEMIRAELAKLQAMGSSDARAE